MFRVGMAGVEITPDCKVHMGGSFELRVASEAVCKLCASAMVLDDGNIRIAWVSCDLVFLDDEFTDELRTRIGSELAIPAERVFISCTHTHNGPAMFEGVPPVSPDARVVQWCCDRIVQAACQADDDRQPADVYYATSFVDQSFNRRRLRPDGTAVTNPGPCDGTICSEGPEDQELQVLWFQNADGEAIGIVVNYSAHPTMMLFENVYSADFPGEMRRSLQNKYSWPIPVMYLQGACGNTSPIDFTRPQQCPWGIDGAVIVGESLANVVYECTTNKNKNRLNDLRLSHISQSIELQLRPLGPEDMSVEDSRKYLEFHPLEDIDMKNGSAMTPWYFAKSIVDTEDEYQAGRLCRVELNAITIGPVVIATNPAELFVEYQLEIKRRTGGMVMSVELTNGYCGYLITPQAWENGSYESRRTFAGKLHPDGGAALVDTTVELIHKLRVNKDNKR